jgi:hypothetical protein
VPKATKDGATKFEGQVMGRSIRGERGLFSIPVVGIARDDECRWEEDR